MQANTMPPGDLLPRAPNDWGANTSLDELEGHILQACGAGGRLIFVIGPGGIGKSEAVRKAAERLDRTRSLRLVQLDTYPYGESALEGPRSLLAQFLGYSRPLIDFPWRTALHSHDIRDERSLQLVRSLLDAQVPMQADPADADRPHEVACLLYRVLAAVAADRPLLIRWNHVHWASPATIAWLRTLAQLLAWQPIALTLVATVDTEEPEAGPYLPGGEIGAMASAFGPVQSIEVREPTAFDAEAWLPVIRTQTGTAADLVFWGLHTLGPKVSLNLLWQWLRRAWRNDLSALLPHVLHAIEKSGAAVRSSDCDDRPVYSLRRSFFKALATGTSIRRRSDRQVHRVTAQALADELSESFLHGQRAVALQQSAAGSVERAHKLLLQAGMTAMAVGDWKRASADFAAAATCEQQSQRLALPGRLTRGLGHALALLRCAALEDAAVVVAHTLELARTTGSGCERAACLELQAGIEHAAGRLPRACDAIDRAMAYYQQKGDAAGLARCHEQTATWQQADATTALSALSSLQQAVAQWQRAGRLDRAVAALQRLAEVQRLYATASDTAATLQRGEVLAVTAGDLQRQAWFNAALGAQALAQNDYPAAERFLRRAFDLYGRNAQIRPCASVLQELSRLENLRGAPKTAQRLAAQAAKMYQTVGDNAAAEQVYHHLSQT